MEGIPRKTACALCRREDELLQNCVIPPLERVVTTTYMSDQSRTELLIQACRCDEYVHASCLKNKV